MQYPAVEPQGLVAVPDSKNKTFRGPRLLMIGNFLSSGVGQRWLCEELSERLKVRGFSVLCCSRKRNRILRLADMTASAWSYRDQYDLALVDVFSGPAFLWAEAACFALRRAGKPYVLSLRGGGLPFFARRWPSRVRRLLDSADVVTAPSRYLQSKLSYLRGDIILVPNAIECAAYRAKTRHHLRPHLIWVRAFHRMYDPLLAILVVAGLKSDFPDVLLSMAGPDKDGTYEKARELARDLQVEDRVVFHGPVAKAVIPELMSSGDIFLNTTTVDNTPVTVLEAMASGLCVVSTNVGGVPFLLEDGRDGLLVPPSEPAAMIAAVRRLLTQPELSESLSNHAQQKAAGCDWPVVLDCWEQLIHGVLQRTN